MLRVMKLTFLLLTVAFLQVSARGFSQQVTLHLKEAPLEKVFREIERQTGYGFLFTKRMLSAAPKVTIEVRNAPLEQVLQLCFKDRPLTYSIVDKTIVVKQREPAAKAKPVDLFSAVAAINIRGVVREESGRPLPAVSVVIPGTPLGSMTNDRGEYFITGAPENATLVVSYVSYETQRIPINGRTVIDIVLKQAVKQLDETVVIGYGTTTKRKSTGSVSSVTAEEIAKQPVANPLNALQGRIAGAVIYQSNGLPGSRVTIQIRGVNSLSNGQQPLYIIDGVPFNVQDQAVPATNDINSFGIFAANRGISPFSVINPSDVERIDVLKDADATAIYGTRGANGVVLITTKKGKAGKTKLDLNVYRGAGKVSRYIPMMNTAQYLEMRKEAFKNDGLTPSAANAPDLVTWDQAAQTDWQRKYLGGTAETTDAQATLSGGDARTRFLLNTGYHKETTVLPGDFDDSRVSARLSADHNSLDHKFNASTSVNYAFNKSNLLGTDLSTVYNLPPNMPLYNADGSLLWNANFTNPEAYLLQTYIGKTSNLTSNALLRYTVLPGLELKTSLGFNRITMDQNQQQPSASKSPIGTTPTNSARFAALEQQSYIIEPQATYNRSLGNGKLSLLAGSTFQNSLNEGTTITADNYSNPALLGTVSGAGNYSSVSATYTKYRYTSLFGRLNYDWAAKYLFNAVVRRDGSSRFGANNRFGTFWSLGAGWVFSEETFLKAALPFLSFGKLRASYGLTGNDQFQDYQFLTTFATTGGTQIYQGSSVLTPSRVENPDLQWETNKKMEIGLDLGFVKDRILLTTNYYRNRSGNQLGYVRLGSQTGFNAYAANFDALIQNAGFEAELNTINISTKNFTWKTSFNLTAPETKLLEADQEYFYYNQAVLGKPLSVVFRYDYQGVDPQTGRPLYRDASKDSLTFTPSFANDRGVIGYSAPKFYGGLNNTFGYKGFDLSFFFQFSKQEGNILPSSAPGVLNNGNQATLWLDRWRQAGDVTTLPRATTTSSIYSSYGSSDAVWGDASFARLRNVSLSYSFPEGVASRLRMSNLRLYVQGQNLYTWTKNKYVSDPETVATINQSPVVMPPLRVITAGINVSF